jgi:hypothetical protein
MMECTGFVHNQLLFSVSDCINIFSCEMSRKCNLHPDLDMLFGSEFVFL